MGTGRGGGAGEERKNRNDQYLEENLIVLRAESKERRLDQRGLFFLSK